MPHDGTEREPEAIQHNLPRWYVAPLPHGTEREPNAIQHHLPRWYVAALPHDGTEREPEAIEHCEVVGEARSIDAIFYLPFIRAETADEEQPDADADVGQYDVHPYIEGQRLHKGEYPWFLFVRFLYHDADAEAHVRFREVDDTLSYGCYRQRSDSQVRLLKTKVRHTIQEAFRCILSILNVVLLQWHLYIEADYLWLLVYSR